MMSTQHEAARHFLPMRSPPPRNRLARVAVAVLGLMTGLPALAATKTVDCASTAWTSGTCWNPDGVPGAADIVHVTPVGGSTTTLSIAAGTTAAAASLDVDSTTGTLAQVNMSGGTLTLSGVYMVGVSGSGTAAQSGGALTGSSLQIGPYAGSSGSFTFSGASSTMALSQLYVGLRGNGSFLVGNGTATLSSQLVVGYFDTSTSASFVQNGGAITVPSSFIGVDGSASFEQASGSHVVDGTLYLGYGPGGSGSYTQSGGTLSNDSTVIGRAGAGSFVQKGGSHTVTNALTLGQLVAASGSYTLSGGTLTVGSLRRGLGNAAFNWSGGALNVNSALDVAPGEVFSTFLSVGDGKDLFTPTLTVSGSSTLGVGGGTVSVLTLNNHGRTNLSAGVLDVGNRLNNSGTLAMGGGAVTGSGSIVNTGSLTGAGSLSVSGSFISSALVRPEGGTLTLHAGGGVSNSGLIDLQAGSRLYVVDDWTNAGQVQLAGGALAGGRVQNGSTGLIAGFGLIDGAVANAGLLSVGGGSLSITGNLTNSGITHLAGPGNQLTGAGLLTNTGTVQGAGNVGMRVANSGTLEAIGGTLSFSAPSNTNTATGILVAGVGGKLLMTQGLASNAGLIQLDGGTYDNSGVAMSNSGRIVGDGNLRAGTITNTSQIAFSFGSSSIAAPFNNQSGAKLIVSNGAQATFAAAVANAGEMRVSAGGAANFFGPVSGAGSFTGTGQARFEGGFSPGASPALVTISFDVFYGSDSPILMELGGTTPGNCAHCSDKIIFNGSATLEGGPLNVVWWDGFQGQAGDSFDLFDFNGGLTGRFGSVNLPVLGSGLLWQTEALYSDGVLRVAAVPEPHAWALMLLGGGVLLAYRRRAVRWG